MTTNSPSSTWRCSYQFGNLNIKLSQRFESLVFTSCASIWKELISKGNGVVWRCTMKDCGNELSLSTACSFLYVRTIDLRHYSTLQLTDYSTDWVLSVPFFCLRLPLKFNRLLHNPLNFWQLQCFFFTPRMLITNFHLRNCDIYAQNIERKW